MTIERALPDIPGSTISPTELTARDGLRRISNSEVQTFKRCRRKWWFTYYRRLSPRYESPVGPLAIGSRIHRALQYYYATQAPDSTAAPIDARDALELLIALERRATYARSDVTEDTLKQFDAEADLERIMLDGYVEWLTDTGEDANYEVIGAEVYREVDLPEFPVRLIDRLDVRVRLRTNGQTLFIDHKTTAAIPVLIRQLPTNEQMLWYILIELLGATSDETPVSGAVYNMLRKVKRTVRAKPPFYGRHSVYHNSIEMASFLSRVQGMVETILSAIQRLDLGYDHRRVVYPTPTKDCDWDCPFSAVCRLMDDGSYAEEMIDRFFTTGDPLGYYTQRSLDTETRDGND